MKETNDGGSAFPTMDNSEHYRHMGMSLRDYFAASALTGLLSDPSRNGNWKEFSESAYECADAMLRAREGKV